MIFPAELGFHCDGIEELYWTPTPERVAEAALPAFLSGAAPELAPRLGRYLRQYVGVVRDGRPCVYVNLFARRNHPPREWRTRAVCVEDGGDAYFQVLYDVESGTFSELYVNGEA